MLPSQPVAPYRIRPVTGYILDDSAHAQRASQGVLGIVRPASDRHGQDALFPIDQADGPADAQNAYDF
jgi:hypothetical protein